MHIQILTKTLTEAVKAVRPAVGVKSPTPALEAIKLEAEGALLHLTGYDGECAIMTAVEARVYENGAILAEAKTLDGMLSKLHGDMVEIKEVGGRITVKSNATSYRTNWKR
jgi:DNA polymerase III sliding clamp (beta) subunit (PCNA family)